MALRPKGDAVFCGKDDGTVSLYDLKTGTEIRVLYRHKSLVRILTLWPQGDIIMSVDASNGLLAWKLQMSQKEGWVTESLVFQSRLDCGKAIIQVLPGATTGKFIISTRQSDHLWTTVGQQEDERTYSDTIGIRKWIQHQQSPLHMICIEGAVARIYTWKDWSEVACVPLIADIRGLQLKSATLYTSGRRCQILVELCELDGSPDTRGLQLLDSVHFNNVEDFSPNASIAEAATERRDVDKVSTTTIEQTATADTAVSTPLLLVPQLAALARRVAHVIGLSNNDANQLVFLDTHSWVCSADLETLKSHKGSFITYSRHFFVPYDWLAGTRDVVCAVAPRRDVLFARNDDLAVIKGGLEYAEKVDADV